MKCWLLYIFLCQKNYLYLYILRTIPQFKKGKKNIIITITIWKTFVSLNKYWYFINIKHQMCLGIGGVFCCWDIFQKTDSLKFIDFKILSSHSNTTDCQKLVVVKLERLYNDINHFYNYLWISMVIYTTFYMT